MCVTSFHGPFSSPYQAMGKPLRMITLLRLQELKTGVAFKLTNNDVFHVFYSDGLTHLVQECDALGSCRVFCGLHDGLL